MKVFRLAVIFDQAIHVGGGYQQALNAALLAKELSNQYLDVVFFTTIKSNVSSLASYGINSEYLHLSYFEKVRTHLRKQAQGSRALRLFKKIEETSPFERILLAHRIDLVYFLSPSSLAESLEILNYITTVWDLCHRDDPEFPEVRCNRTIESRDRSYANVLPRAAAIIVDSTLGKTNVVRRYGVDQERVHVLPFQAAEVTRRALNLEESDNFNVVVQYSLDVPYIFYPAQFWAHKNHVYLLEGLKSLEQLYGKRIGAIFSGGDQGNLSYVSAYVDKIGLSDRVRFVGFVPNEQLPSLYLQSLALVMPSYFGPTNLPPLEAFRLGVPVLYPDKAGLRDQVGNAALLMDLRDPASMASQLNSLIEDKQLREHLISAGFNKSREFDDYDRNSILSRIIDDFRWRRLTWQ